MSEMLYNIDFSGKIIPGWNLDEVKSNLSVLLNANEDTISKLFSGQRFVIKKNVNHQTALNINNALKDAGADCEICPINDGSVAAPPPPLPAQTAPAQPDERSEVAAAPSPTAVTKPAPAATGNAPGAFWYVVAILFFLVPTIWGGATFFNTLNSYLSTETRLAVPGETDLQIDKPGKYAFFYETSMFKAFNAMNYQIGRDFDIYVMDLATGEEMALEPVAVPATEDLGGKTVQSFAQIQFDTLGVYNVAIEGQIPNGDALLIRRYEIVEMGKGFLLAGVLVFLGFIIGPIMGLVVFVKRHRHHRAKMSATLSEEQENNWAMWAHISTFSSMLVPLGNFIGPIVVWQLKKDESEFVADQAKEALNFQISLVIYFLISFVLCFVVIGFFLLIGLVLFSLIFVIVAGVKSNEGEYYRYPMCLRLVSQKKYPSR
jgi:uncharacterized Tic20 family protein